MFLVVSGTEQLIQQIKMMKIIKIIGLIMGIELIIYLITK